MSTVIDFDTEGVSPTPQVRLRPEVARYAGLADVDSLTSDPDEVLHLLTAAEQAIFAKGRTSLLDTDDIELLQHIEEQRRAVRLLADDDAYDLAVQERLAEQAEDDALKADEEVWAEAWAAAQAMAQARPSDDSEQALALRRIGRRMQRSMRHMSEVRAPMTPDRRASLLDVTRFARRHLLVDGKPFRPEVHADRALRQSPTPAARSTAGKASKPPASADRLPPLAGPAPAAAVTPTHSQSERQRGTETLVRDELWSAAWAAATTLSKAPGDSEVAVAARRTGTKVLRTMERMSATRQPLTPRHLSMFRDVIGWAERYVTVNGRPYRVGA